MINLIKNKISRRIIIGILLLFGLAISSYNLLLANNNKTYTENAENNKKKQIVSVETIKVVPQNISNGINLSGITKPLNTVMVSPKMTGKIISFNVKEGEKVHAGKIIAQMEKDSTLLASYNNAQTALINTITATNQDINNAELAVTTAEMNLRNTKINAEENIKNAELAVDAAKVALENAEKSLSNTNDSSEQSIQNAYDKIRLIMQGNLLAIKAALTAVGNIIGEDPGISDVNDNYEDVLGVRDIQSLDNTKGLFSQAKKSYENIKDNCYNLNSSSSYFEIDLISNEMSASLSITKDMLNQTLIMLDNTITKSGFTSNDLSALKTIVNTNLTNINNAINSLQTGQQAIVGAKLLDNSSEDSVITAYKSAKKNLERAEQGLIIAKTQAKTQIDIAQKQLESAKSNLLSIKKRAELQVNSAQAQVNSINAQLKNTIITAPISGTLNQFLIETGEMAMAGKPIASIVNEESIEIELALTEFDIGRISNGQEVKISFSVYPEEEFLGNIYYVGLVADPVSKKFPIKIQVSNKDKKIKAGMIAQVKISFEEQKDVLAIPKTAIFTEKNIKNVYVVDKNNRIKIVSVKTEPINEDMVIVKEGLFKNDIVVINGNYDLEEGDEVNIINN